MAKVAKFDRTETVFPTRLKLDDEFNGNLKLVIHVASDTTLGVPKGTVFVGVKWGGKNYILGYNERDFVTPEKLIFSFAVPPTVETFLRLMGEPIPKKETTYNYSWITGFRVSAEGYLDPWGDYHTVTDELPATLTVEIPQFPWDKVAIGAGVGVLILGALIAASRGGVVERVRERLPARV